MRAVVRVKATRKARQVRAVVPAKVVPQVKQAIQMKATHQVQPVKQVVPAKVVLQVRPAQPTVQVRVAPQAL